MMTNGFASAFFLPLAGVSSVTAAAPPQRCPADIRTAADVFDRAQIDKDHAALDRMVRSDLVFVDGDGRRLGKREFIAGWMDPTVTYGPIDIQDRYVKLLARDTAVVGGDVVIRGTASGKPFASRVRFSDLFQREKGCWRAVHIQSTRVKG
jgi:ketosteroid isomerase-like protein